MEIKVFNVDQSENIFYTVKNGDTLESISKKLNVPKKYIVDYNIEEIYEGYVLYLPRINFSCYIVKPLDTLKSIAKKNNCRVEDIRSKNNLSNDTVFVGQKIYL